MNQISTFILFILFLSSCINPTQPANETKSTPVLLSQQTTVSRIEIDTITFKANITSEIGNKVLSILQDKNGNYWFGANDGAYYYDGKTLILFTTKDGLFQNQVQEIQEDQFGNIWFTTGGFGVNRFDARPDVPVGGGQKIKTFTVNESEKLNNTSDKNWKTEYGDLWFYAGGGTFYYNNGSFSYLPFPKPDIDSEYLPNPPYASSAYGVYCILKDTKGNIWFGTQAMGVCCYDPSAKFKTGGQSFVWFTAQGLRGPAVLAIFEDKKGDIWFGTNGKGLFCYDGKRLTNFTEGKGLGNHEFMKNGKSGPGTLARVWSLAEDNKGTLWIGTADAGVWAYDGKNLVNYTTNDGLPASAIETIYKDKNGELWFGTNGDGVYKLNAKGFLKFKI